MKRIMVAVLAVLLIVTAIAPVATAASANADKGAYVNGIWKWNEPVTLTAYIPYDPATVPDPTTGWFYEWIRDIMNVDLQVEGVVASTLSERNSLMMASGDLPDIMMRWNTTSVSEVTMYGDQEGLLTPMNPYLNEDVMPYMCAILEDFPGIMRDMATPSGNLYLTPEIQEHRQYMTIAWHDDAWYNIDDMKAAGYESFPKTVDELLDYARKLKEVDPRGKGDSFVPLGGGFDNYSMDRYLLHAFGLAQQWPDLLCTVFDGTLEEGGEFVFVPTSDAYYEYLKYMNTLYSEGLIEKDYFTIDGATVKARISEGCYSIVAGYKNLAGSITEEALTYPHWELMDPLTSDINPDPFVVGGYQYSNMAYVLVSSDTTDLQREAAFRMLDYGYDNDDGFAVRYSHGPKAGEDELYGFDIVGWSYGKHQYEYVCNDVKSENPDGRFGTTLEYTAGMVGIFGAGGGLFDRRTDGSIKNFTDTSNLGGYVTEQRWLHYSPFYREGFTGVALPEDQVNRSLDLETVLLDYYKSERAKFITGARPLTEEEWAAYCKEMAGMGADEYYKIQSDAFNAFYRPEQ